MRLMVDGFQAIRMERDKNGTVSKGLCVDTACKSGDSGTLHGAISINGRAVRFQRTEPAVTRVTATHHTALLCDMHKQPCENEPPLGFLVGEARGVEEVIQGKKARQEQACE
jgi:hypothetical protein